MTDLKSILENKSINIIVYDEPFKGRYYSAVYKIDNNIATIIAPNNNGTILALPRGIKITITFWDDIRAYMFEATIIGRANSYIPTFNIEMPEKLTEIQRRNYVRIPVHKPISFQILSTEPKEFPWLNGYSLDLSGGGIKFKTSEKITKEDALNIRLELPNKQVQSLARVCRVTKDDEVNTNIIAAEFTSISKKDREEVISFIFDIQRKLLKKGLV